MNQSPTVGRIVHFVMPESHPASGKVRPAIVTSVWSETNVSLNVFLDPGDELQLEKYASSSVSYSETNEPRTWHWPERV